MDERAYLSIGQVLDLLKLEFPDLTISKIRFLESQGLLDPERTPSGYRKFYETDIDRLRFILREQQQHYLPLKVIRGRLGTEEGDATDDEPMSSEGATAPSPANGSPVKLSAAPPPTDHLGGSDEDEDEAVSLTLEELAAAAGLTTAATAELERFGLLAGRKIAGTQYYDADCLEIARLAAGFRAFGVEARHLRMYRTSVEREASFFEQVVTPMLKQRNPQARRQAIETLFEMSRLGQAMRDSMLRQLLSEYTGRP